jgi:hypothetical protein
VVRIIPGSGDGIKWQKEKGRGRRKDGREREREREKILYLTAPFFQSLGLLPAFLWYDGWAGRLVLGIFGR